MAELTPTPPTRATSSCCSPESQATCCEPADKAGCCTPGSSSCSCSAGQTDPAEDVREVVRDRYAAAARAAAGTGETACRCAIGTTDEWGNEVFGAVLYADEEDAGVAEDAITASLGCGVPTAVADLKPGETVLDLGSGAGGDVLISARRVAPDGKAIGLDMTDEMLDLARINAQNAGVTNVEFVKGYLETMPLPDASVDVVISNCVINLSGDKPKTIREAARVLRPGGRFAISDVIADLDMDEATKRDMAAWTGCIAGALTDIEFRQILSDAGLEEIEIRPTHKVHEHASAAIIRARKPAVLVSTDPADPTFAVEGCALDAAGLGAQLTRYGQLSRHAHSVERLLGEVRVRFADDVPTGLLGLTLDVERRCCRFLHARYDEVERQLTFTVETVDQEPRLDSLFAALTAR